MDYDDLDNHALEASPGPRRRKPSNPPHLRKPRPVKHPPTLEAIRSNLSEQPWVVDKMLPDEPLVPVRRTDSKAAATALYSIGHPPQQAMLPGHDGIFVPGAHRSGELQVVRGSSGSFASSTGSNPHPDIFDLAKAAGLNPTPVTAASSGTLFYNAATASLHPSATSLYDATLARFSQSDLAAIESLNLNLLSNPASGYAFMPVQGLPMAAPVTMFTPVSVPMQAAGRVGSGALVESAISELDVEAPRILGEALRTVEPSTFDLHLPNFVAFYSNSPPSTIDPFLLSALLLRAAKLTLQPRHLIRLYRDKVMQMLPSIISSGKGNAGTIIALSWCSEWLLEAGELSKAHQLHEFSLLMCRKIGLNLEGERNNNMSIGEWIGKEERRRAFWKLFIRDTEFISAIGAPPVLLEDQCFADLPANDYIWFSAGPAGLAQELGSHSTGLSSQFVRLPPDSTMLSMMPTQFGSGDWLPLAIMLARIDRTWRSALRRFRSGSISIDDLVRENNSLCVALEASWYNRLPAPVQNLDGRLAASRPKDLGADPEREEQWRDAISQIGFVRYAEGGIERLEEGIFDVEWIMLLLSYHALDFSLNGSELHSLCFNEDVPWVGSAGYERCLHSARRMTDLLDLLDDRWVGSVNQDAPRSSTFFPWITARFGIVMSLLYVAPIWLKELHRLGMLSLRHVVSDHGDLEQLRLSMRACSNHKNFDQARLRDLALASISALSDPASNNGSREFSQDHGAPADSGLHTQRSNKEMPAATAAPRRPSFTNEVSPMGAHQHASAASLAGDFAFSDLVGYTPSPATGSHPSQAMSLIPSDILDQARAAHRRFASHVSVLKRMSRHVRMAAASVETLEMLWKEDPCFRYVEEALLR